MARVKSERRPKPDPFLKGFTIGFSAGIFAEYTDLKWWEYKNNIT